MSGEPIDDNRDAYIGIVARQFILSCCLLLTPTVCGLDRIVATESCNILPWSFGSVGRDEDP